jgi:D-alanyl-D-alanine carboxypeptidase/D-alanyl-D-alanine-endopeptidase (penicillin-binding protein 4)
MRLGEQRLSGYWRASWALVMVLLLASCEGSPTLPARVQAAGSPGLQPSPSASPSPCRTRQAEGTKIARRPARWKTTLDTLTRGRSVGVAVGVRGTLLYEHDARQRRTPASNEKLMLSMALFDRLGPHFRIQTRAAAHRVKNGVVEGDLWILGAGDPSLTQRQTHFWGSSLTSPTLQELADRIESAGTNRVTAGVRGATGYFARDFDAPGWQPYVPHGYVELASALSLNGNFHVNDRPEWVAARTLSRQLASRDIGVGGAPGAGPAPSGLSVLARVKSPPLTDLVAYMDQTSNNFFAETLGKLLGARTYGAPGTIRNGARALAAWARQHGVTMSAHDSSGLSYRDKISPLGLVTLLAAAERRPWGATLRDDLAAPGEGTLAARLRGLDVHAKTGTLFNSDSALSGWVRRNDKSPWLEFSILDQSMPKALEDKIVGVLAHARFAAPRQPGRIEGSCS